MANFTFLLKIRYIIIERLTTKPIIILARKIVVPSFFVSPIIASIITITRPSTAKIIVAMTDHFFLIQRPTPMRQAIIVRIKKKIPPAIYEDGDCVRFIGRLERIPACIKKNIEIVRLVIAPIR